MGKPAKHILLIIVTALLLAALVGLPACGKAKLASTTTAVTSSQNPSTYGDSVTFTATVSATTGIPTGTVAFKEGTSTLGTPTISSGQATYATSSLSVGNHTITAVYSGDSKFATSTSTALTQTVNQASTTSATQLVVRYIDVGQGDSILLDYGTYEMLIDGGPGPTNVASYIKPYVDGPLDVVVATHPDADHIGGLIAVLDSFTIGQIWIDGQATTTQTYTQFTNAVQTNGAPVHIGRRGDTIDIDGLTFHVLNPTGITGTTNNDSIVLELDFGQVGFLFEGDAEQEAEASMIAAGLIHHVDIVKIGHHGSDTASSAAFVNATTPEVAIYSCAMVNPYGHPAASVIARWQNAGATVYGTNVNGTITVTTNGSTYTVSTTR